jgi:hypothetical protein
MPPSELHQRKRAKNLTVAGILLALIVLFFIITIIKLGGASAPAGM